MTPVPIPSNYGSLEDLSIWLQKHMPHEYHIDGGARWVIVNGYSNWHITFARAHDATYFNLKWPH